MDKTTEQIAELTTKVNLMMKKIDHLADFIERVDGGRQSLDKKIVALAESLKFLVDKVNGFPEKVEELEGRFKTFKYIWATVTMIISAILAWVGFHGITH